MVISTQYSLARFSKARPQGIEVDTVVLHATAGPTFKGALSALVSQELSYHYIIEDQRETDGLIRKLVPYSRMAYHAGSSYGPHEKAHRKSHAQYPYNATNRALGRVGKFVAGTSVNAYSVGISFVNLNDGLDGYSAKQYKAAMELILELETVLPLKWLTTHALVSPGRKTDPKNFPALQLAADTGLNLWRY
jgi:N-acetyl-anhydromuramyl-L-alanine amidase AmpD